MAANVYDSHNIFISILLLLGFIVVAVELADFNSRVADAVLALFVAFFMLQLLGHGTQVMKFMQEHNINE